MEEQDEDDELITTTVGLRVIVSYDVGGHRKTESTMVDQFVHGRKVVVRLKNSMKRYFYPGLVSRPGVQELGQSVLMMRERDAEEFGSYLYKLKVPCRMWRVWLRPIDLL